MDTGTANVSALKIPKRGEKMKYKRDIIKEARVKGLPYINYRGKHIPGRTPGEDCR